MCSRPIFHSGALSEQGFHEPGDSENRLGFTLGNWALGASDERKHTNHGLAHDRYSAMGGGVPLLSEGEVVAGVGVSGGTTEEDVAIVEAALR